MFLISFFNIVVPEEASQVVDVKNIKHIAENKRLIGDIVEKTVTDWESQKESFYKQTGIRPAPHEENEMAHQKSSNENRKRKEPSDDNEGDENDEEQDDFAKDLEEDLLFQPEEFDNEEMEPTDEEDM